MTAWHLRAVQLPDGVAAEDRWLTSHGWSTTPARDAEDLPGSFSLPGLVDAHSHVSFGSGGDGPTSLDHEGAEANRSRFARDGVAVMRDAGGAPGVVLQLQKSPSRPLIVPAGRHLAPAGMYFEAVHDPVEPAEVIEVALSELSAGAVWVKLVADFPPAAGRALSSSTAAEQTYDLEVMRQLIDAVHRVGRRVAVHVTTPIVADLVRLGVDSVEHGTALTEDTVTEMSRRGTAWTPTLCAVLSVSTDAPLERRQVVAARREQLRQLIPLAIAQGVSVLTGSDVVGSIPLEIRLLIECGMQPTDALRAATTTAMRFLGSDAADAPPTVVMYDADPREHPEVLAEPAAVVIGGARVR